MADQIIWVILGNDVDGQKTDGHSWNLWYEDQNDSGDGASYVLFQLTLCELSRSCVQKLRKLDETLIVREPECTENPVSGSSQRLAISAGGAAAALPSQECVGREGRAVRLQSFRLILCVDC